MINVLALVLFFGSPGNAQAKSFYVLTPQVGQGGTAVVRIDPNFSRFDQANRGSSIAQQSGQGPLVCLSVFGNQYAPNKNGYVVIGVATDTVPTKDMPNQNKYQILMVECGRGVRLNWDYEELEVLETNFEKTRIAAFTSKPKPRTDKQKKTVDNALNQLDKLTDLTNGQKYILPLDTVIDVIDPFGPIYGNNLYLFHTGLDLRALVGTPVKAINGGRVVLVAKNYRRSREGNMVILYHGLGIFSVYMHLSKFQVKEGSIVEQGQIIGLTGRTGTGIKKGDEHLHLNIREHDTYVDPLRFIDIINQHIKK
ncbi:MAG: M23 family metallopeptidase [Candidatus Taylorbacteria bacterium]|nr:M23 family metallopeptidase [Candidatus Taylorbacteria bacterium]